MTRVMKRAGSTLMLCAVYFTSYCGAKSIYVDATGGNGAYRTVSEAIRGAAKYLKKGDVEISIRDGVYPILKSIELPQNEGGHRLTISNEGDASVTLFGGEVINPSWFKPLTNGEFADRLVDQSVRSKIVVCDLFAHGVRDLGEMTTQAWSKDNSNRTPPPILTIGGERMTLARWPNSDENSPYMVYKHFLNEPERELRGYEIRVQEIIDDVTILGEVGLLSIVDGGDKYIPNSTKRQSGGTYAVAFDRMKYWGDVENIFVDGVFNSTWEWSYNRIAAVDLERRHITLQDPELRPLGEGESVRLPHMHYENIPEEIDSPGEYYIDRKSGLLYLYPPTNYKESNIVLATLSEPMFRGGQCSNITLKGVTIDTGRDLAIDLKEARNCTVEECTISNFIAGAIRYNGDGGSVRGCHIYGIGGYGVHLDGGDAITLTPANNEVVNCWIHDFGWDQKSQMPAVMVDGVGHSVRHCDISNGSHFAIRLRNTNDVVLEYNKIHHLPTYHFFDGGAIYIYSGNTPQSRGNVVRYNYMHDIPTIGIYPDNYTWGVEMYGNLFERVGNVANRPVIYVNGGGECRSYNNIAVDCPMLYIQGRHPSALRMKDSWKRAIERYGEGKVEVTPLRKYDDFKEWLVNSDLKAWLAGEESTEPDRAYRAKSYLYNNLFYHLNTQIYKDADKEGVLDRSERLVRQGNMVTTTDPGFVDAQSGNYNLREDAVVFEKIEDFEPLPIDKMGLIIRN